MQKNLLKALVPAALLLLSVSACKKETTNNNTQTQNVSTTDLFNYSDAWGLLAGVKTVTYQTIPVIGGQQEIILGTAVTAFNTTEGSTTYQDAGTVQCNTKTLTKQSNNAYVFQPSQSDITGIDFSSGSAWSVSGAGNVPAINYTFNAFPSSPTITSNKEELTLANGYTFSISGLSTADSVLYILASGDNYVEKRVGGNTSSVTFSAADLSTLQASDYGLIQVTPYKFLVNTNVMPGKKVYFVNQVTVSSVAKFK